MGEYPVRSQAELQAACDNAVAGDVILVHGGRYDRPTTLKGKRGTPERPIVIRAADEQWVSGAQSPNPFWGGSIPSLASPHKPTLEDFAFLVVDKCSHVVVDALRIRDCWPSILFVKDSTHLTVRDCRWRHGTYAIFAKGEKTSHLLIDGNEWQQDDSAGHLLWSEIDWASSHGNEGSDGLHRYFNGGFMSSKGVRGNVVLRRNRIMDAYNGIRMKVDVDQRHLNTNVHIFGNEFTRIRDNPIEPEAAAFDWHVRHNRLVDCHSWFSFDGVTGGHWYFYGNTGHFESRQGQQGKFGHTMGRVLKLSYVALPPSGSGSYLVPDLPWYVFNNSWHLRCPIVGGANPTQPPEGEGPDFTAKLAFFNNAFQWCDRSRYGDWLCEPIEMMRNFDLERSADVVFDYDISDRADFIGYFRDAERGETNGKVAYAPIFKNAGAGVFDLASGSDASGTGWARDVSGPGGMRAEIRVQEDGTLNRGAMQDYGLVSVPDLEAKATALLKELGAED